MLLKRYIEEPAGESFDLIIIGGGITGAAVAYIAAARGLKVALFEKKDYGGATSAATSKLIHGGLRYLANGELKLVRESLRERRILGNIAPNFVYPLPFVFPNYKKWGGNIWKMMAGMYIYDMLSYDKKDTWDRSKKLQNHKLISHRKTVRASSLRGSRWHSSNQRQSTAPGYQTTPLWKGLSSMPEGGSQG